MRTLQSSPRVLGVIAVPRTGSNRLLETLESAHDFRVVGEIFHPEGRSGLERVAPELGSVATLEGSDPPSPELVDWVRCNPAGVIDQLVETTGPGRCVVFKLFPGHVEDSDQLGSLFRRDDIAFIILKRRPIDCYISFLKAKQLDQWFCVDTSHIQIEIAIHEYLRTWAQWNRWYIDCMDLIKTNARPLVHMKYEDDLLWLKSYVVSRAKEKLAALGLAAYELTASDDVYFKQDRETDHRRKVSNWTDFVASLKALGLEDVSFSNDGLDCLLTPQRLGSAATTTLGGRSAPDPRLVGFNVFSQFVLEANGEVRVGCGGGKLAPRKPLRFRMQTQTALGVSAASGQPLISCLMVTRNRPEQCRLAVSCFQQQTWRERELVVIDTSADDELARWVESLNDPRIRFVFMPGCMDRLGDLRNLSVETARGEFVAQWDDDDLSHPTRLQAQMGFMSACDAPVGMLQRELVWMPQSYRLSIARPRTHENTLICNKAIMPAYPSRARLEDTPLVEALARQHAVALLDQPDLYIYVAHGTNTWDDDHMDRIWRTSTDKFHLHSYDRMMSLLSRCYPIGEYQRLLSARN